MKSQRALPWWENLALCLHSPESSLDAPVDGESGKSWDEHLANDELDPHAEFVKAEAEASVRAKVDALPPRLALVVRMRFGFDDGEERTLQEVGDAIGLSRERARQLESEAFALLRDRCAA